MSAERITGDEVRRETVMGAPGSQDGGACWVPVTWLHRLAAQLDADAQRLAAVTADRDMGWQAHIALSDELPALRADAEVQRQRLAVMEATLEGTEAERDEWKGRASVNIPMDTQTRADAAEYRALQAVIAHPMRDILWMIKVGISTTECTVNLGVGGGTVDAPTPTALLAKLDALADTRKPKPEPDTIERVLGEIDCRIEHGADSGGHLEYVRDRLRKLVSQ